MSWDASLVDDRGHDEGSWNYTHNTNAMLNQVLEDLHYENPGRSWYHTLDGADGPSGAAFLHTLLTQLESDPDRYRRFNPSNGWGDYDSLLKVLREMRDAVPEWPCQWSVTG